MKQSDLRRPQAWTIRRAELVDVPAVSRLLGAPHDPAHPLSGSSDEEITSATRLVLTHVALELGEFWVAIDDGGHILAAVVLLPAMDGEQTIRFAVRQELGLTLPLRPDQTPPAGVPEEHWLLLPAAPEDAQPILAELLAVALPTVDGTGIPVLSIQSGPPSIALVDAGFEALPAISSAFGSAALRPAAIGPGEVRAALTA
jgi:hypothetical protein